MLQILKSASKAKFCADSIQIISTACGYNFLKSHPLWYYCNNLWIMCKILMENLQPIHPVWTYPKGDSTYCGCVLGNSWPLTIHCPKHCVLQTLLVPKYYPLKIEFSPGKCSFSAFSPFSDICNVVKCAKRYSLCSKCSIQNLTGGLLQQSVNNLFSVIHQNVSGRHNANGIHPPPPPSVSESCYYTHTYTQCGRTSLYSICCVTHNVNKSERVYKDNTSCTPPGIRKMT